MARKNLLTSITEKKLTAVNSQSDTTGEEKLTAVNSRALPPAQERNRGRGAFGAITKSIDELAERAEAAKQIEAQLLEGLAVVELDTDLVDSSFIIDRLGTDADALSELIQAVEERGQDTPILVRPHPDKAGRFMVVFGHRRLAAARALSRPVRAVVKDISNRDHVIAQGQENSARSNLSYVEKAMFAANLLAQGYDREVIMTALSTDKASVSKFLSVVNDIPAEIIQSVGAAKNSGRDPWYRLAMLLREPENRARAEAIISSDRFSTSDSDQRLALLLAIGGNKKVKSEGANPSIRWMSANKDLSATVKKTAKGATIALSNAEGGAFAQWISENLPELYTSFIQSKPDREV